MLDLSRLSGEQRRVVLADDGPLLVMAGPGSGKTTTLAARIVYLVQVRAVPPAGVLAITFTTAAARTLRHRLERLLGGAGRTVDVTTFHALGLRIIRQWGSVLGFRTQTVVYNATAARELMREAAASTGLDLQGRGLNALVAEVERYRIRGATGASELRSLAETYEALLLRRGGIDYPAMLTLPLRAFEAHPPALQMCQDAYRAILADEFQDVCRAQYALLRLLAERHRNIAVVGDPRQSLYAWRGANVRFFHDFLRDFPEAQVLVLAQNFRSTGRLVDLANTFGVALGYPQGLWTANPRGQEAFVYGATDEREEATFVASEIVRLIADRLISHAGEAAVLYRTNGQAGALAEALRARGLAYRVAGGNEDIDGPTDGDDHQTAATPAATSHRVVLTTIHAAKGSEWRVVFVVGLEDGLLPHAQTLLDPPAPPVMVGGAAGSPAVGAGIEEELRVVYVAVTRPRERLYLTYCRTRQRGEWRLPRNPSRFLQVIPAALIRPAA